MESGLRLKGNPIKSGDRRTVLNVFKYFEKWHCNKSVSYLVKNTSEPTSTSQRSIYRFRNEERKLLIANPRKTRQKVEYKTSKRLKYDGFVTSEIRKIVHSFFYENTPSTMATVLAKVNKDPELQNFRKTILWKLHKETGFCYERALLLERNDIILWRHSYFRQIKKFRREKRPIVYLDETWINVGQTINKV